MYEGHTGRIKRRKVMGLQHETDWQYHDKRLTSVENQINDLDDKLHVIFDKLTKLYQLNSKAIKLVHQGDKKND